MHAESLSFGKFYVFFEAKIENISENQNLILKPFEYKYNRESFKLQYT